MREEEIWTIEMPDPWESLSDLDRSIWVAKRLMDWPTIEDTTPYFRVIDLGGFVCYGIVQMFTGHGFQTAQFKPSINPSHDFMVLRRVRERWDDLSGFVESLKTVRWPRCNVTSPYSLEMFAEPGDYSHAAYLTIQTSEEVKQKCGLDELQRLSEELDLP